MKQLVLLRHGQSEWNRENRFTGWKDVDLSEHGHVEAHEAGRMLREEGFGFDVAYTSVLKRAIRTLWIVQDELDLMWIPVHRLWRLNERHYGALQGLNKIEMVERHGSEQVQLWRRSYDVRPPAMAHDDERHPAGDPRYAALTRDELPSAECLADVVERMKLAWYETITVDIHEGKRVLIVAHGNSLRALVKILDNIADDQIVELNIPTGIPLVYELEDETLRPIDHRYLGDPDAVAAAIAGVANQTKRK